MEVQHTGKLADKQVVSGVDMVDVEPSTLVESQADALVVDRSAAGVGFDLVVSNSHL